jgi:pyrimidine-nucleoside phosphorylase
MPLSIAEVARLAADPESRDADLVCWLRHAYENPLSVEETAELTVAMADSGDRLDLTGLPRPWLDKHSTGGVGDKTTLVILPLLAACGLTMVKMSGRGLGITGGTIDKLEAVGMRTNLDAEEMVDQARQIGIALSRQTSRLAPADGRLYQLRNDHQLIDSIPLIVSSILSKKIAGGCDTILLDVKCGSGAFMPNLELATQLRDALVAVGTQCGLTVFAEVTDMDQPLGSSVGNAIEVAEARQVLLNQSQSDNTDRFREFVVRMAADALSHVGHDPQLAEARLADGSAAAKARQWFEAQDADFDAPFPSVTAPMAAIRCEENGWIARIDAGEVGEAGYALGIGRREKSDPIDPRCGFIFPNPVGTPVRTGEVLAYVLGDDPDRQQEAAVKVQRAIRISDQWIPARPLILD